MQLGNARSGVEPDYFYVVPSLFDSAQDKLRRGIYLSKPRISQPAPFDKLRASSERSRTRITQMDDHDQQISFTSEHRDKVKTCAVYLYCPLCEIRESLDEREK